MYYRVAIQVNLSPHWQWKSTLLCSLDAVFQWLRLYRALPQERLRVFSCSSREEMNEQLGREHEGLSSTSVTAAQFLEERRILPTSMPQVFAWVKLLAKVQTVNYSRRPYLRRNPVTRRLHIGSRLCMRS